MTQTFQTVGVIGAGTMGAGIAQVAATAGCKVKIYDARDGAGAAAIARNTEALKTLASKGKLSPEDATNAAARMHTAADLGDFHDCDLVIEAIVEELAAKQALFKSLESICAETTVMATNTSSISVTAIAAVLARPENVVGMHFFNPAPILPLVEVVSGQLTSVAVADRVEAASRQWKKTPVRCKSSPGFIVNRVARPFYGEAFRVLESGGADVATIDLVLREAGGFKMGAFELLDLIGLDVNLMVTKSVWNAYFQGARFRPSITQEEMVAGGLLGRKSGRGFYNYPAGVPAAPASAFGPAPTMLQYLTESDALDPLIERVKAAGIKIQSRKEDDPFGAGTFRVGNATVCLNDGRTATQIAYEDELTNVVTLDLARDFAMTKRVALAKGDETSTAALADAVGLFRALGIEVSVIDDIPGMIVARTVAMLANEAADAVLQGVASAEGVDTAMKLGVNHPEGPLAAADRLGNTLMNAILVNMHSHTGDDRYRQSILLQRKVWGESSFHPA
ncbi:MAG: 3-hydroxyacyl-CoA dehydrogenase [Betaproteobacteria bacterium]|nr:MAG: 3-hydroxyacyl-CoA dehydrogenase [Betaproteobacteria bacterium]